MEIPTRLALIAIFALPAAAHAQIALPADPAQASCPVVLSLTDPRGAFSLKSGTGNDLPVVGVYMLKNLRDRVGIVAIRARLGWSATGSDDTQKVEGVLLATALEFFTTQYCIGHPLDNLKDALDELTKQMQPKGL